MKLFLIIIQILLRFTHGHDVILLGSRVFAPNSDYSVQLDARNMNDMNVVVLFQAERGGAKEIYQFNASSTNFREAMKMKVEDNKNLKVSLLVINNEKCKKGSIVLKNANPYTTFIQLNKPVYEKNEYLQYSIIVIDYETKPFKYEQLKVKILDGNSNVVHSENFKYNESNLVVGNNIFIPNDKAIGEWKIHVNVNNDRLVTQKRFRVNNQREDFFELLIHCPDKISIYKEKIQVEVYVRNRNNNYARGIITITPKVTLSAKFQKTNIPISKDIDGSYAAFNFTFNEHFGFNMLQQNATVNLFVEFEDKMTKQKVYAEKQVVVFVGSQYKVNFVNMPRFLPGFPFNVVIEVLPESQWFPIPNALEAVLRIKYSNKKGVFIQKKIITNNQVSFITNPSIDCKNMTLEIEVDGYKAFKHVNYIGIDKNYEIRGTILSNISVGAQIKVQVKSLKELDNINIAVINERGIMYNEKKAFPSLEQIFLIQVTEQMAPLSYVIIWHEIKGNVYNDVLKINLPRESKNKMNINVLPVVKPDTYVDINVETFENSFVSLNGYKSWFDDNFKIYNRELSTKENTLLNVDTILSRDLFILQPLESCTEEERKFLNEDILPEKTKFPLTANEIVLHDITDTNDVESFITSTTHEEWFNNSNVTQQDILEYKESIPDSLSAWKISGFSLHPDLGLAFAQPKFIKTEKNYFIDFFAPSVVTSGVPFEINVQKVFNYTSTTNGNSSIELPDSIVELKKERWIERINCFNFTPTTKKVLDFDNSNTFILNITQPGEIFLSLKADYLESIENVDVKIVAKKDDAKSKVIREYRIDNQYCRRFNETECRAVIGQIIKEENIYLTEIFVNYPDSWIINPFRKAIRCLTVTNANNEMILTKECINSINESIFGRTIYFTKVSYKNSFLNVEETKMEMNLQDKIKLNENIYFYKPPEEVGVNNTLQYENFSLDMTYCAVIEASGDHYKTTCIETKDITSNDNEVILHKEMTLLPGAPLLCIKDDKLVYVGVFKHLGSLTRFHKIK